MIERSIIIKKLATKEYGTVGQTIDALMKKEATITLSDLLYVKKVIEKYMRNSKKGSLKTQTKNGKHYYFCQFKDPVTEKYKMEYITKENREFAIELAQRSYYKKVLPIINKAIESGKLSVAETEINEIYDNMPEARKELVTPLWLSVKERLKRWNNENYKQNTNYSENLVHETDRGERVRSKSEKEIANELNRNKDIIDYKYERPLAIMIHGSPKIIYPDFTIINKQTGKIKYWEHAGKMDDPKYVNSFVEKINIYLQNNIYPGKDLIITYETATIPLNNKVIKKWTEDLKK